MSEPLHCPSCGEAGDRGQLVCLHCGGRLALTPRRRRGRSAMSALAVVAVGGIVLGFALGALANGDDDKAASADRAQRAAALERQQQRARREREAERQEAARAKAREQARSGTWPSDLKAYTVVLVTAGDEAAARQTAIEAQDVGLKAGVLRSDDYDLGQGFWIVYAGTFDTQDEAAAQAGTLAERYPGAYPQLVDGS